MIIFYFYKFYLVLLTLPVHLGLISSLCLLFKTCLLWSLWDLSITVLIEVRGFWYSCTLLLMSLADSRLFPCVYNFELICGGALFIKIHASLVEYIFFSSYSRSITEWCGYHIQNILWLQISLQVLGYINKFPIAFLF